MCVKYTKLAEPVKKIRNSKQFMSSFMQSQMQGTTLLSTRHDQKTMNTSTAAPETTAHLEHTAEKSPQEADEYPLYASDEENFAT